MKKFRTAGLVLGTLGLFFAACSTDSEDNGDSTADSTTGGTGGGNTGGSQDSSGGSTAAGGTASGGAPAGGSSTGGTTPMGGADLGGAPGELPDDVIFTYDPNKDSEAEVCAATQIEATEVLLDMFIILDQSGSMAPSNGSGTCPIGGTTAGTSWCNAVTALSGFFGDSSSVGMGVAYAEFDSTGCGAFAAMDVPFGLIEPGDTNGHLAALNAALANDDPAGRSTATEGAVDTLIEQTTLHVPASSRRAVSILITDGEPSLCFDSGDATTEMQELNALLLTHYQTNDIPSYVIGMDGASGPLLEALAVGVGATPHTDNCLGGAVECSYYSVGAGDPAVFIAALESIRGEAVGCEYTVPQASVGLSVLDSLEVKFTEDVASGPELLERVADELSCSADTQFWIDVSGVDGPVIKLCPETCSRRGPETAVDLSLACEGS